MDNLHAAELLYRHNKWRRGDDTYDMANPKELGEAIDMAIQALRADVASQNADAANSTLRSGDDGRQPYPPFLKWLDSQYD